MTSKEAKTVGHRITKELRVSSPSSEKLALEGRREAGGYVLLFRQLHRTRRCSHAKRSEPHQQGKRHLVQWDLSGLVDRDNSARAPSYKYLTVNTKGVILGDFPNFLTLAEFWKFYDLKALRVSTKQWKNLDCMCESWCYSLSLLSWSSFNFFQFKKLKSTISLYQENYNIV